MPYKDKNMQKMKKHEEYIMHREEQLKKNHLNYLKNKEHVRLQGIEYRRKNKEKIADSKRLYREKNKEKIAAHKKEYRLKNLGYLQKKCHENYILHKAERNAYNRNYSKTHKNQANAASRQYRQKLRLEVILKYGGNPPHCACCGEIGIGFLTVDHKNSDGHLERNILRTTSEMHRKMLKNFEPDKYQILCYNCNCARQFCGICPHQKKNIEDNMNMEIKVIGDGEKS